MRWHKQFKNYGAFRSYLAWSRLENFDSDPAVPSLSNLLVLKQNKDQDISP